MPGKSITAKNKDSSSFLAIAPLADAVRQINDDRQFIYAPT